MNKMSSLPLPSAHVPLGGFGGKIAAQAELPISAARGTFYIVQGRATIKRIAPLQPGAEITLLFLDALQIIHSSYLICPGALTLNVAAGDVFKIVSEENGVWQVVGSSLNVGTRRRATQSTTTLYANFSTSAGTALGVAIGGGDDATGDGSLAKPFKTAERAAYYFAERYDLGDNLGVVQMADGTTDTQGVHWAVHALFAAQGGAALTINGGTNSVLAHAEVFFGGVIRFENLTIRDGISVGQGAAKGVAYLGSVTFGVGSLITTPVTIGRGGHIYLDGPITFIGTSVPVFAMIVCTGGEFLTSGFGVTVAGNQTISGGWIFAQNGGRINFGGTTITNAFTVTGPRGAIYAGGDVSSGPGGSPLTSYWPGDGPFVNNGGYYDNAVTTPLAGATGTLPAANFPALNGEVTTAAGALAAALAVAAITGKTEDTAPDGAADFLLSYDASATALKKILLHRATAFKVGSFTRNTSTATGTQAVTGVGFKPKAAIFLAVVGSTTKASWGFSDGTTHECLYDYSGVVAGQYNPFGGAVRLITNGSDIYDGVVQSWDSDGFTFSWTKNGAPPSETATIYYIAAR